MASPNLLKRLTSGGFQRLFLNWCLTQSKVPDTQRRVRGVPNNLYGGDRAGPESVPPFLAGAELAGLDNPRMDQ